MLTTSNGYRAIFFDLDGTIRLAARSPIEVFFQACADMDWDAVAKIVPGIESSPNFDLLKQAYGGLTIISIGESSGCVKSATMLFQIGGSLVSETVTTNSSYMESPPLVARTRTVQVPTSPLWGIPVMTPVVALMAIFGFQLPPSQVMFPRSREKGFSFCPSGKNFSS